MEPIAAFSAIAMVILIGFTGSLMFEKTKVPDVLILILLGFLIGPIARQFGYVFIPVNYLDVVAPYFAAMALMIILFDGGLNLNFDKVLSSIGISSFHSIFTFLFSAIFSAMIAYFIPENLGNPFYHDITLCLLLGTILGGVSSAVVLPIIKKANISEDTETTLALESVLTDVMCVVTVIAIIEIRRGGGDILTWAATKVALGNLASAFSIAIVAGALFGIIWLKVLKVFQGKPYSFMITIAALMLVYSMVEYVGGSGAMSALIFGLVLSNKDEFARMFKIQTEFVFDESVKLFQSELSFFIRTFFFVYLGLVFTLSAFLDDGGNFDSNNFVTFLLIISSLTAGLLIARYFVTEMTTRIKRKELFKDKRLIWAMLPRGLATAVLASLPIQAKVVTDHQSDYLINIAFLIILITTIITTIGVFVIERNNEDKGRDTVPMPPKEMSKKTPPPPQKVTKE